MNSPSKPYFDNLGADWDRLRRGFFSERVREEALRVAGVKPGCIAADLGAGTGFVTEALIARGVSVIAMDQSRPMLDALAAKFPEVDCRVGEAERIPIDDASVDHAFANMFLHHVEAPADAIAEMRRIVRPGGRVVITDLDRHDFEFLRDEHHDRWMGFDRAEIESWLRAAGLADSRVDGIGEPCCATSCDGERSEISIFVASGRVP